MNRYGFGAREVACLTIVVMVACPMALMTCGVLLDSVSKKVVVRCCVETGAYRTTAAKGNQHRLAGYRTTSLKVERAPKKT